MRSFGLFLAIWACGTAAYGQSLSVFDGATPAGLAPGSPTGSYALSGFEHHSPFSGVTSVALPLRHIGGRGEAGFDVVWNFNQTWIASKSAQVASTIAIVPYPVLTEVNGSGYNPNGLEAAGAVYAKTGMSFTACSGSSPEPASTVTRLIFRRPDGTEVELIDQNTHGAAYTIANPCGTQPATYDANRGTIFASTDGSEMVFTADARVLETKYGLLGNVGYGESDVKINGNLQLPNGVTYQVVNSDVVGIRDRNGNVTTIAYNGGPPIYIGWYMVVDAPTAITDANGNQTTFNYNDSSCGGCISINWQGTGGAPRTIKINQANLSALQRDGGGAATMQTLFPNAGQGPSVYDPMLASTITIPDGTFYSFRYNIYGEVTKIGLPTGSSLEYDYGDGNNSGSGSGFEGSTSDSNPVMIYRRLLERREYASGLSSRTHYTVSYGNGQTVETQATFDPGGTQVGQTVHTMDGSPRDVLTPTGMGTGTNCNAWNEGLEVQTDSGMPSALVTVMNAYVAQTGCMNNPRLQTQTTKLDDSGQVSQVKYVSYDAYNNVTEKQELAWGQGTPGGLLRDTKTTYLWGSDAGYAAVNLVQAPLTSYIYDAGGTKAAGQEWHYDENAPSDDTGGAAVPGRDPDPKYGAGSGFKYRGNVTSAYSYLNTMGGSNPYVGTQMSYDILGNMVTSTDPNGHTSTYAYGDAYSDGTGRSTFAYATMVTDAIGLTEAREYDYQTGAMTRLTDANGVWTDILSQSDPLDRTTSVLRGRTSGSNTYAQTAYSYPNPNVVITQVDRDTPGDHALTSYAITDGLGRPVESDTFESPSQVIATCRTYDALGAVKTVSNPFRAGSSPACPGSGVAGTSFLNDSLGRVTKATYADQSMGTTSYLGSTVTATDPAGRKKSLGYDALGRMTSVAEDPGGTLNYQTLYQYDLLGDRTLVCQGGSNVSIGLSGCQNGEGRSFAYDTLGRLIGATNPESGAVTYGYDAAGNQMSRVDGARNITTTYTYDTVNRLTEIDYSDGVTPSVYLGWNGTGPTTQTYGAGRLSSVIGTSGIYITGYDVFGRVTQNNVQIPLPDQSEARTYQFGYTYNLAGALTSELYPSGRMVNTGYDGAGRPVGVSGVAGAVTTNYLANVSYAAQGAAAAYEYGNGVWHTATYNTRLQPGVTQEGMNFNGNPANPSVANPLLSQTWNWSFTGGSGAYNDGNLAGVTVVHSGGGLGSAFTAQQSFGYDALRRLTDAAETGRWTRGFSYDTWGNSWVDTTRTTGISPAGNMPTSNVYNGKNQNGGASYDAAGNQTVVNGNGWTYDAENRGVWINDPVAGSTEQIIYDGLGQRVRESWSTGGVRTFVHDIFGNLAAEYSPDAAVAASPCQTCYLSADLLGSTRLVTDEKGNVVGRHDYLPYGEEIVLGRGSQWGPDVDPVRQKFTGQQRDTETGVDYFQARYYGSTLERFTSTDPANAGGGCDKSAELERIRVCGKQSAGECGSDGDGRLGLPD